MARYLKISPSDLQKEPIMQPSPENGQVSQTIGVVTNTPDRIESSNFVVRITSLDTGRKLDLKLNFKQKITAVKELVQPVGNGRRQI